MKKYINVVNSEITDVIFERQTEKINKYTNEGTLFFLEETEENSHKINGKSISDENAVFIFKYVDGVITEKTNAEILVDPKTISANIETLTQELAETDVDIPRGVEDIMDALYANNVLKKDKTPTDFQNKLIYKKAKRQELIDLINS